MTQRSVSSVTARGASRRVTSSGKMSSDSESSVVGEAPEPPVFRAAYDGDADALRDALTDGANPNATNSTGYTALRLLVRFYLTISQDEGWSLGMVVGATKYSFLCLGAFGRGRRVEMRIAVSREQTVAATINLILPAAIRRLSSRCLFLTKGMLM